jgi:hypothetical protein
MLVFSKKMGATAPLKQKKRQGGDQNGFLRLHAISHCKHYG